MHAVLTVFAKEFRENLRDRRTLLSALLFGPLFGPLLFSVALFLSIERGASSSDKPLTVAIAHGERAPNLMSHLRGQGIIVEPVTYDDKAARSAVRAHSHKLVLLIPPDYGARFAVAEPAPLLLYA